MPGYGIEVGHLPVQAGFGDAEKLAEAGDHGHLRRVDREEASQNQRQGKDADHRQQDDEENVHSSPSEASPRKQRDYIGTWSRASYKGWMAVGWRRLQWGFTGSNKPCAFERKWAYTDRVNLR